MRPTFSTWPSADCSILSASPDAAGSILQCGSRLESERHQMRKKDGDHVGPKLVHVVAAITSCPPHRTAVLWRAASEATGLVPLYPVWCNPGRMGKIFVSGMRVRCSLSLRPQVMHRRLFRHARSRGESVQCPGCVERGCGGRGVKERGCGLAAA